MSLRTCTFILMIAALGACASQGGGPQSPDPGSDPQPASPASWRAPDATPAVRPPISVPAAGRVPGGQTGVMLFFSGDEFELTGDPVPGTMSFDGAAVWDWASCEEPAAFGTGSFAVTVGEVAYAASGTESFAVAIPDDAGTDYLLLAQGVVDAAGTAQVGYVIVPLADFAVGATVALDGTDRVALFAAGPVDAAAPAVAAAAVTGTVTFVAGSLDAGGTVTATVSGDFGPIAWPEDPCESGECEPPPDGEPTSTLTAGAYNLGYDATAHVLCEGALVGREAEFEAVTLADAGFIGGPIDVTVPDVYRVTLSGAALEAGFGAPTLDLDWAGDPEFPGIFVGFALQDGTGPAGTMRALSYLYVDAASATATLVRGGAGLDFEDGRDGYCTVDFDLTLTAP